MGVLIGVRTGGITDPPDAIVFGRHGSNHQTFECGFSVFLPSLEPKNRKSIENDDRSGLAGQYGLATRASYAFSAARHYIVTLGTVY